MDTENEVKNEGAVEVENWGDQSTGFTESVQLAVGDVIQFQDSMKVFKVAVNGNNAYFTLVEIIDGPNKGQIIRWYSRMLNKSARVYDEPENANKAPLPVVPYVWVKTGGQPAEDFRKFKKVSEAMPQLAGKKLKVTKITPVRTVRYGQNAISTVLIYDYEYADQPSSCPYNSEPLACPYLSLNRWHCI